VFLQSVVASLIGAIVAGLMFVANPAFG
jgi:hypothetical protein